MTRRRQEACVGSDFQESKMKPTVLDAPGNLVNIVGIAIYTLVMFSFVLLGQLLLHNEVPLH